MKKSLLVAILSFNLTLSGCSFILEHLPGIYKIDIKQGNIIDQEMIDQLRPNMTKRQVLYILGSPMLTDSFHKSRWDYVYSIREKGSPTTQKHMTLYFQGDALTQIEGDFKPNNVAGVKPSKDVTVDVPPRNLEKTLWEMIIGVFGFGERSTHVDRTYKEPNRDRPLEVKDIPN